MSRQKPHVLLSSCLTAAQSKSAGTTIRALGGTVAKDHFEAFTHFVATRFTKSLSGLIALAAGAVWVSSVSCIHNNSHEAGSAQFNSLQVDLLRS